MISYHPVQNGEARNYAHGFRTADTDDLERIARGISRFVWSPIVWAGGRRHEDCFQRADLCVLDFDSPGLSLAEAVKTFCDSAHIIGTTRNHQVEKHGITCDRFRVVLRFAHPIFCLKSYRHSLKQVVARYPADTAPKDGARFFFPCREIVSIAAEGYVEGALEAPVIDEEAQMFRTRRQVVIYRRDGRMPRWLSEFLRSGRCCGKGRNHTIYRAAINLALFGEDPGHIRDMIASAPFDRGSGPNFIGESEILQAVNNGIVRGLRDG